MNGFSILYSQANHNTDNTLITILGKPNGYHESWQDNLVSLIVTQLLANIPNAFRIHIVNNEAPLIEKLRFVGILSANQHGSLQSIHNLIPTTRLEDNAKSMGITPNELMARLLQQNLMPDTQAEPFFNDASERLRNEPTTDPIFNFSTKTTAPIIDHLHELSNDAINYAMTSSTRRNYVIHKNAIITGNITPAFLDKDYNNLLLIDTSHSDNEYLANWKFLDPDTITGFGVIGSNTNFEKYQQVTQQVLCDYLKDTIITKTIALLKEGM